MRKLVRNLFPRIITLNKIAAVISAEAMKSKSREMVNILLAQLSKLHRGQDYNTLLALWKVGWFELLALPWAVETFLRKQDIRLESNGATVIEI